MSRLFAIDAGALATPGNGIARYLSRLLPPMMDVARDVRWCLHGRSAADFAAFAARGDVSHQADGLPPAAGKALSLFTTLPRALRRRPPDLFWGPAHRLPVALPRTTARVVTIHDLAWLEVPRTMRAATRWLDRALMPRALLQSDRIVAVSGATRDAIVARWPALGPCVRVVHEAAARLPAPGPRPFAFPYVLCVGTIEPRKNPRRLVEAFARLPGDVRLVFAGAQGWGTQTPSALASHWGIADRVLWLGPVDDATLSTLYAHARCLALPSLYEGFGLPILEALSLGTPVLYGDNSSMPEVAGEAGIGVDAGSVESIAQGLARLLSDDALHATLASRARAQAAKFSWDRAARETLAVFEEAVAACQARRA